MNYTKLAPLSQFLMPTTISRRLPLILFWLYLLGLVSQAIYRTIHQYQVWAGHDFTRLLLDQPGYFFRYAFGRFWLNLLVALLVALLFYLLILALSRYQTSWFAPSDANLALLTALIAGWPGFIIFLPLVATLVILFSLYRALFLKKFYTTLTWPLIISAIFTFFISDFIIHWLDWSVLFI